MRNAWCNACLRFFLVAVLLTTPLWASFTLEQVMSYSFPSELVAAKHSPRIAWVFNAKGVRNVWVADAPDFAAHQVTHYAGDDGQPIASLRLTPDGHTVVYARGTEVNHAGEAADPDHNVHEPKQQVWAADVENGNPRLLGEMGCGEEGCEDIEISPDGQSAVWTVKNKIWIAAISGSSPAHELTYVSVSKTLSSPRWSPDDKQIAFVSDRGDHSFIVIYQFGRDKLLYMAPSVDRDDLPRWSPDGKQIAFVRIPGVQQKLPMIPIRPLPWAIWVGDPNSGAAHKIWQSGPNVNDSFPELTEDQSFEFAAGNRLVFASEQDGWNHLYSISAEGGQPTLLTPGEFETEDVTFSGDKQTIFYSSNQADIDRRHLWQVPVAGGTPQALTKGDTIEWSPVQAATGDIACLGSSATTPAMPYHLTSQGRQMIAAAQLPKDFPSSQLVVPKQVVFDSEDGLHIHGQLFVPAGRTTAGPALVFIHGGSIRQMVLGFHYMQYYHNAYAENEYLASLGYVVLSVNYRTGIMYGRAFREPEKAGWRGASEYKDIVAAGHYLQTLPIVERTKIGLWGGSYGGFLTAMGLARNSDLFAAGVDLHGVHDWSAFLARWENRPNAPDTKEAAQLAFESSPDASVSTWRSPVLLIQGDDDRNVPFTQTVDLVQRLREHHVPFEQLVFPDEIHDFLMWKTWMTAYGATANFFDRVFKKGEQIGTNH